MRTRSDDATRDSSPKQADMQCRDVRDLAESFLSEQLLVETNHDVLRHLESCPECRSELEGRRLLRAAIHRAFLNADALRMREDFAHDIRPRLRASRPGAGLLSRRRAVAAAAEAGAGAGAGGVFPPGRPEPIPVGAVGGQRKWPLRF